MNRACEAIVELGDSETGSFQTVCGAPCPRDVCPFAERVTSGRCERRGDDD